jgi:hypothetical protein
MKERITRLARTIDQSLADFTSTAMALVSTKVEHMYQIHMEKAQMRLAPHPKFSRDE